MSSPVATSHILIVASLLPESILVPSGENATAETDFACHKVRPRRPVASSQRLTDPSMWPETSRVPSCESATDWRKLVARPASVWIICPVATSQTLSGSSYRDLVTNRVPSAENATRSRKLLEFALSESALLGSVLKL